MGSSKAHQETLANRVINAIDQNKDDILRIAETVRQNPEIGWEEFATSKLLADSIREQGSELEKPLEGFETAFRARRRGKSGDGPVVAVLTHYDALPGLGHGCGHNMIAASAVAAAAGLGSVMDEIDGEFLIIGTPAEEGGAGKVLLADAGVFDDIDASLMLHHGGNMTMIPTEYPDGTSLAVAHIDVEYFGQTAHAGADPHNGRNALNGLIKFFTGIDALRQHLPMSTRLHGIITHGGDAPNIVPGYASAKYYVRAESRAALDEVLEKVERVASGAAELTLTEARITKHSICNDMRPNYQVGRRYRRNMEAVGLKVTLEHEGRAHHSSDFGNVSHLLPSVMGFFAISDRPIPGHSQDVVDASGSEFGYEQFIRMAKAMSLTALDLLTDQALLSAAKKEHEQWRAEAG